MLKVQDRDTYRRVSRAYVHRWIEPEMQHLVAVLSGNAVAEPPDTDDEWCCDLTRAEIIQADFPHLSTAAIWMIGFAATLRAAQRRWRFLEERHAEDIADRDRWRSYRPKNRDASSKGGKARAAQLKASAAAAAMIKMFTTLRHNQPDASDATLYRQLAERTGKKVNTIRGQVLRWKRSQSRSIGSARVGT